MTIDGMSPNGNPRQLEVDLDPDASTGERWIVLTLVVGGTLYAVRVPAQRLHAALDELARPQQ